MSSNIISLVVVCPYLLQYRSVHMYLLYVYIYCIYCWLNTHDVYMYVVLTPFTLCMPVEKLSLYVNVLLGKW